MASAPSASAAAQSAVCGPPISAAAAGGSGGGGPANDVLCEECGEREGKVFCLSCKSEYCVECDAAVHVRARKDHPRVPSHARPILCPKHKEEAHVYCVQDERLACIECVKKECSTHHTQTLAEAAAPAREALARLLEDFKTRQEEYLEEIVRLEALRATITERIKVFRGAVEQGQLAQAKLAAMNDLSDAQVLQKVKTSSTQAEVAREATLAAIGDHVAWWKQCAEMCSSEPTQEQDQTKPAFPLASSRSAAATASRGQMVPDLTALSPPRAIPFETYNLPCEIRECHDNSFIVAYHWPHVTARRVWLDNMQPSQALSHITARATAVLPLFDQETKEDKGLLIVSYDENRVERTGNISWRRIDVRSPWAAVLDDNGDTALVTEYQGRRVLRIDMHSGVTTNVIGKGVLVHPLGIAVSAKTGHIVVADESKAVHVFDRNGAAIRSLGHGWLKSPYSVSVDGFGRVYVADHDAHAIVVLEEESGAFLSIIPVKYKPRGVLVTRQGEIVVSWWNGRLLLRLQGLLVIE